MRRILIIALGALCATLSLSPVSAQTARDDCAKPDKQLLAEGCKLLDEFMAAFNDSDAEKFAATNNYPHIRITGPKVTIWNTAADYMRDNSRAELLAKETIRNFRVEDQQMGLATAGSAIGRDPALRGAIQPRGCRRQGRFQLQSFYTSTRKDGRWGIQARSSFAGIAGGGAY